MEEAGNNPQQTTSNETPNRKRSRPRKRPEHPSSAHLPLQKLPQETTEQLLVVGSSHFPVIIPEDGEDEKPETTPISRLKALRFPNTKWPLNITDDSSKLIIGVKKLLVSEFLSPNKTMSIDTMVDRANGAFSTLQFLGDNYELFYRTITSFIRRYQEWVVANELRNRLSKEIIRRYEKLEAEWKRAKEDFEAAEANLAKEMDNVVFLREKLISVEQELARSEAKLTVLAAEKGKCELVCNSVKVEIGNLKARETLEKLMQADDRRNAAINGISEAAKKLQSFLK